MHARRALALVAIAFLAGCADAPEAEVAGAAAPESAPTAPQEIEPSESTPPPEEAAQPAAAPAREWPPLEQATIRPGVEITRIAVLPLGGCTANFVFTERNSSRLFLGTAAHCVQQEAIGDDVWIAGETAKGRLAYSSWKTHDARNASDDPPRDLNDFALLEIRETDHHLVHPALLRVGGPVALGNSSQAAAGDGVLAYGGSSLRAGQASISRLEGEIVARPHAWTSRVKLMTPGIPADSGSPVLTTEGAALGVLVTLSLDPRDDPPSNGVSSLDLLLEYARVHGGIDMELATWALLRDA